MEAIGVALLCIFPLSVIGTANFTLLPMSSEYCQKNSESQFTPGKIVVRQMQLHASDAQVNYSADAYNPEYVCKPKFFPLGKVVQWRINNGGTMKFWYLRIRINGQFSDCKSRLILTEKHRPTGLIDNRDTTPITHVYDCNTRYPVILDGTYRNMEFMWNTTVRQNRDSEKANYVMLEISKYARFSRNTSLDSRIQRCQNGQDMFFCENSMVCIPGNSVCDGQDDCFDGASDEMQCEMPNNTDTRPDPRHPPHGSWMTNLPWIALGILPVILVFALARICSQKRSLDIGEDYKMGFNTEEEEEEGEDGAGGTSGRSDRSCSPAESGRLPPCPEDYADEGYTLPRHEKNMSASSDYLPANFVELTATPPHRGPRRPEAEPRPETAPPKAEAQMQQRVAVQINNPVYGNNVYVDVPTSTSKPDRGGEYARPCNPVAAAAAKAAEAHRTNGQEEYTPLLPPSPAGAEGEQSSAPPVEPAPFLTQPPIVPDPGGSANDDYEDEPPPYDEIVFGGSASSGPPTQSPSDCEGGPEMLRLKPLLRQPPGPPTPPKAPAPVPAPNGAAASSGNRDSDYDKNYIVV